MKFLITQVKEQKLLEMEVDANKYITDMGITEKMVIHTMFFDKDVFAEEKEVREYLKALWIYEFIIDENGNEFVARLVADTQVDNETEISLELRRGLVVKAAELLPMTMVTNIDFSEKGSMACDLTTINLHEGLPHIIEIARVAEGHHPSYGPIKITQENLESMQDNFRSKVTGVDLAVNEDHAKNEAFGWFKDVFLSFEKQTLYGQIQWNTKGIRALSEKEYRYFSPEFRFNYVHPHTNVSHGATLLGGALTNYPFLKMDAIVELNNKQETKGKAMQTIDLKVHEEKVIELSSKVSSLQVQLSEKETKVVELSNKVKSLEAEMEKKTKEATHKKLFDENKINAAQLVALNEGKGMLEVLALSEKMNTEPKGTSTAKETIELNEGELKVCAQLGLTKEEFIAANK